MHFRYKSSSKGIKNLLISVIMFTFIFGIFYLGLGSISDRNHDEAQRTLTEALQRSIIHSYAVNGFYPESLQVLLDTYGITYDPERFFVDYRVMGSNIMPNFVVIVLESE